MRAFHDFSVQSCSVELRKSVEVGVLEVVRSKDVSELVGSEAFFASKESSEEA